jgi:hypothetical protein
MITLKRWMELVNYRITEGSDYGWNCYGNDAYSLSFWNGIHGDGGFSSNIIFDTKNQKVYEVDVCDYTNDRAYRLIDPEYASAYRKESSERTTEFFDVEEAWEGVRYINLEVEEDFIAKADAIVNGNEYDARVMVPVDLDDNTLMKLFTMAHEQDITLNQLVENILTELISSSKKAQKDD